MTRSSKLKIAAAASEDTVEIWSWTVRRFGHAAAVRYEALIRQAMKDIAADPRRPGSKLRLDLLPGLWLYHLNYSRNHVGDGQAVGSPRHFLMYRHLQSDAIEILRVVHDSCDLRLHLPELF